MVNRSDGPEFEFFFGIPMGPDVGGDWIMRACVEGSSITGGCEDNDPKQFDDGATVEKSDQMMVEVVAMQPAELAVKRGPSFGFMLAPQPEIVSSISPLKPAMISTVSGPKRSVLAPAFWSMATAMRTSHWTHVIVLAANGPQTHVHRLILVRMAAMTPAAMKPAMKRAMKRAAMKRAAMKPVATSIPS